MEGTWLYSVRCLLVVLGLGLLVYSEQAASSETIRSKSGNDSTTNNTNSNNVSQAGTWDFLLLVQQWPGGVCLTEKEQRCEVPATIDHWTMHGLWPDSFDGSNPTGCNDQEHFQLKAIHSILEAMNAYWVNLYADQGSAFWAHEWNKHGTCAMALPELRTELLYFNRTLQVRQGLDITKALQMAGITPSSKITYSRDQIVDAVKKAYGVTPILHCELNKITEEAMHPILSNNNEVLAKQDVLAEMALCIDKSFRVFECPANLHAKGIGRPCGAQVVYIPNHPTKA